MNPNPNPAGSPSSSDTGHDDKELADLDNEDSGDDSSQEGSDGEKGEEKDEIREEEEEEEGRAEGTAEEREEPSTEQESLQHNFDKEREREDKDSLAGESTGVDSQELTGTSTDLKPSIPPIKESGSVPDNSIIEVDREEAARLGLDDLSITQIDVDVSAEYTEEIL
jgi:hypothetical protein